MTTMDYGILVRALSAETIVVVTALAVLALDLIGARRSEATRRAQWAGAVAVTGLLAACAALIGQFGWNPDPVLAGTVVVDDLTVTFKLVVAGLTIVTVLISMDYDVGRHIGEYYAVMLLGSVGMMMLVGSEELLTIFVALELTSICLYILTAFHKGALKSQEAAVKYFMFGAVASAFLLFGLSYVYGVTGESNLRAIGEVSGNWAGSPMFVAGMLFVLVGLGFKIAVVPFHLWAPDTYEGAPTPVTAFIATGSKVASFFVLTKLVLVAFAGAGGEAFLWGPVAGWSLALAVTATASMVLGNVAAIVQQNVKRLLAYSSIAHAGYILVGVVSATGMGAAAVLFYVIVYGVTNLGAFGVVSALASRAGGERLEHFNGMARRAPVLSLLMMIFMLSLAGIPPLGGFFGKFYLFAAAVQRDAETFGLLWLVVVGILMSAVSLYYYLIVLKHFYVIDATNTTRIMTPFYLNIVLGLLAVMVIVLGVFPEPLLALLGGFVEGW